jgi:hypothetical protein
MMNDPILRRLPFIPRRWEGLAKEMPKSVGPKSLFNQMNLFLFCGVEKHCRFRAEKNEPTAERFNAKSYFQRVLAF